MASLRADGSREGGDTVSRKFVSLVFDTVAIGTGYYYGGWLLAIFVACYGIWCYWDALP